MFSEIASRYDFLNRISSFGFDIYWRKKALTYIGMEEKGKFLDLACGTGDLSFSMKSLYPKIDVFGIDFSLEMLFLAKKKASTGSIGFILGDVL
ncbi:class I SAM-dependent methyltransferase, partial [Escherichia coli]|uniref:class I SAM-dependent methyltransferase n=1 Tax=Escherichia coli TaxID=562 RepID=UPI00202BAC7A